MKIIIRLALLSAALALGACARITLVDPSKPATLGNGIQVMPQVAWNQMPAGDGRLVWTQNGPNLDRILFATGIKPGSPILSMPGVDTKALRPYDMQMLPNDIQDLVVGTMEKQGYANVRPGNLAPCPFGATTGFCFNVDFATADGLEMKGVVQARKQGGNLDVFEFTAPAEYYYGAISPAVSKVFASVQDK